jgi:hypothetical protein
MSNGLNRRFELHPVAFLSSYWDINSSQPQHGEGYGIDPNGIAYLDLVERSKNKVRVVKGDTGLFSSIGKEAPIKAYYLASEVGKSKALQISNESDYFFTDTITGCQFMAYGHTRQNLTVVHSNALTTGGQPVLHQEAQAVRACNYPITIIYGQPNYRAGLRPGEQLEDVTATVIGWRYGDGWHFFTRRRFDSTTLQVKHRVLDGRAYEI